LWDFVEGITSNWETPINRKLKETWKLIYDLYPLHSMLFQYYHSAHAQISWDVRQNSKIIDIFAAFWTCKPEELLVSFDGFSFHLPPEITNRGYNKGNTWYHTDQSYTRNDFECVQSWITGLDVNECDATLGFLEGSHNFHKFAAERFNITEKRIGINF